MLKLRETISSKLSLNNSSTVPLTYICRGKTRVARELINEAEIIEWVKNLGGVVLDPEQLSVTEMFNILGCSDCVIGIKESGLTHADMLMPENTTLLVIQPPK